MDISDRMKFYEDDSKFIPGLPIIVRLDGRNFHNYTKGMAKPYDHYLFKLFDKTTISLMESTNAVWGYTQSDEISLMLTGDWRSQFYFGGKKQKLVSVLASECTYFFNSIAEKPAQFDCRCFQVPSIDEAKNYLVWRDMDATRNSIQMAGRSRFSDSQLFKKNVDQIIKMLADVGVNWQDYPPRFRYGSYFYRVRRELPVPPQVYNNNPEYKEGDTYWRSVIEAVPELDRNERISTVFMELT